MKSKYSKAVFFALAILVNSYTAYSKDSLFNVDVTSRVVPGSDDQIQFYDLCIRQNVKCVEGSYPIVLTDERGRSYCTCQATDLNEGFDWDLPNIPGDWTNPGYTFENLEGWNTIQPENWAN